jgi:hypothetical protein
MTWLAESLGTKASETPDETIGSPLRPEESGSAVMDVLLGQFQTSKPNFQVPAINE